jgi:hypothetical protein
MSEFQRLPLWCTCCMRTDTGLGLDYFDGIEHLFQGKMPADRGLLQPIQGLVELHDLGPESISQNLVWTYIHDFCQ